jgi:hypothetical protein
VPRKAKRAAAELTEARKLSSDDRYSIIYHLKSVGDFGVPKICSLYEAAYFTGFAQGRVVGGMNGGWSRLGGSRSMSMSASHDCGPLLLRDDHQF